MLPTQLTFYLLASNLANVPRGPIAPGTVIEEMALIKFSMMPYLMSIPRSPTRTSFIPPYLPLTLNLMLTPNLTPTPILILTPKLIPTPKHGAESQPDVDSQPDPNSQPDADSQHESNPQPEFEQQENNMY